MSGIAGSAVALLLSSACGGSGGGSEALSLEDIAGLWSGQLVIAPGAHEFPDGVTLNFEQFSYGDRVMQRYPPSHSLMIDGRYRILGTEEAGGLQVASVSGVPRSYISGRFEEEGRFASTITPGVGFDGTYSSGPYEGTTTGTFDNRYLLGASQANVGGTWRMGLVGQNMILVDAEGLFTGRLANCDAADGAISVLSEDVNLYDIAFTIGDCINPSLEGHFDGFVSLDGNGGMFGVAANDSVAIPLNLMR